MSEPFADKVQRWWYDGQGGGAWLLPLSWLFGAIVSLRRLAYRRGWLRSCRPIVPVIVVGNIATGGTGKTPLVVWLVEQLQAAGHRPAVISRGYGGMVGKGPYRVTRATASRDCGDEPALIARRTDAIVVVGSDRCADAALAVELGATVIVADDGLQHYRLQRDIEIAVVDAERGFGNGRLLPAGPLREPQTRLASADLVLSQVRAPADGDVFWLQGDEVVAVRDRGLKRPLASLAGETVVAMAGVGNPRRFFALLKNAGLSVEPLPLADHALASEYALDQWRERTVIVTEKDAVKLVSHDHPQLWYLAVDAVFARQAHERLAALLQPYTAPGAGA
ncbi:MAG: tetraacyldisaccharide 4'-kinase [Pseudomonadota bacterium]